MKRASYTLRKGDETPANIIITFPINLLGSKSKGRIFHRCGSNLYEMNSNTNFTNLSRLKNENL